MGCHTWYSVPILTDKKEIIELAQKFLDDAGHIGPDHKRMYQFAINNELCDVVTELASYQLECSSKDGEGWVVYQDERQFVVDAYNKEMLSFLGEEDQQKLLANINTAISSGKLLM